MNPRKDIIDLKNMKNKEEQLEMACQFAEHVHDPPLTKEIDKGNWNPL